MRWLQRGYDDRDGANIAFIKTDPLLRSLRGDGRFEAIVKQIVAPKSK
jgi:hypothetical protein